MNFLATSAIVLVTLAGLPRSSWAYNDYSDVTVICRTFVDNNTTNNNNNSFKACGYLEYYAEYSKYASSGPSSLDSASPSAAPVVSTGPSPAPEPYCNPNAAVNGFMYGTQISYGFVKQEFEGQAYDSSSSFPTTKVSILNRSNCACDVHVDDIKCKSCSLCADNQSFTADCTNVPHGRKTVCESAKFSPSYSDDEPIASNKHLFFPLTGSSPFAVSIRNKRPSNCASLDMCVLENIQTGALMTLSTSMLNRYIVKPGDQYTVLCKIRNSKIGGTVKAIKFEYGEDDHDDYGDKKVIHIERKPAWYMGGRNKTNNRPRKVDYLTSRAPPIKTLTVVGRVRQGVCFRRTFKLDPTFA